MSDSSRIFDAIEQFRRDHPEYVQAEQLARETEPIMREWHIIQMLMHPVEVTITNKTTQEVAVQL